MAVFSSHAPGTPSWVDVTSPNVDASIAFYRALFGWEADEHLDDQGRRTYVVFRLDGKAVAGCGVAPQDPSDLPSAWSIYVAVDDVNAMVSSVADNGGAVTVTPTRVIEAGDMAGFRDPAGAPFRVWAPNELVGAEVGNEPNTFAWTELKSRDIDASLPFYSDVFGWEYLTMELGDGRAYHLIAGGDGNGLGGLEAMPPQMPDEVTSHWMVYFAVADVAASVATATANGATILYGPVEVPGVGTITALRDPLGARFSVLQRAHSGR